MNAAEIVVIGSLNTDLVAKAPRFPEAGETVVGDDFQTYCGGKGANQAVAAARLGGQVAMLGRVGEDDFGATQIANLREAGVHTGGIQRDPHQPTGTAIIGVESSGENRIVVIQGANGAFLPEHLAPFEDLISQAKALLLQLEIPPPTVGRAIEVAQAADVPIMLDPAPAPPNPLPTDWLEAIEVLTPNLSELSALTGIPLTDKSSIPVVVDTARQLCAQGSRGVIAKLGARGALRVTRTEVDHWPAPEVHPIDTTAAGDCFNAAYAVQLVRRGNPRDAGSFAVRAASLSTTRSGAQVAMPTREEMTSFSR